MVADWTGPNPPDPADLEAWAVAIREQAAAVIEVVPAFCRLLVRYDADQVTYPELVAALRRVRPDPLARPLPRCFRIPVVYGGPYGPDLEEVAALHGLTPAALVALHTATPYRIACLGFMPGFAYLAGLPAALHTPRLASPRRRVAAGSVGIGGSLTGIYPEAAPGGWRIIGRTPYRLFDVRRQPPVAYRVGDAVRFVAVEAGAVAGWAIDPPADWGREGDP